MLPKSRPVNRIDFSKRRERRRPAIAILGVPFDNVTMTEAIDRIERMIASRKPNYLLTANVDFLVQARGDVELRRILFDAHLVLCDGTPVLWASRLLGNALPERVAGSDLVPALIQVAAEKKYRVFFLGATPDSANQAVARLQAAYPNLIIAGHYSPPFNKLLEMDHEEIKRRILERRPDLLLVSFGCPKQEKWIAMHYRSLGVPVSIGVGATIDFLAGQVKRAPVWMQRTGLEWIFRLLQEPRRLFRRYFKDFWAFGWGFLAQWWQLQFRCSRGSSSALKRVGRPTLKDFNDSAIEVIKMPEDLDFCAVQRLSPMLDRIGAPESHCFLEMGKVKFLDSTGVGLLIRMQREFRAEGRQLILLAPSTAAKKALAIMRLQDFFTSAPDFQAAQKLVEIRSRPDSAAVTFENPSSSKPLAWHGEITAANAEEVWEQTRPHLVAVLLPTTSGPSLIRVDLSDVPFIDSTGLGLMVRAKKFAGAQGTELVFIGPQPAVRNVLHLARLEAFLLQQVSQ